MVVKAKIWVLLRSQFSCSNLCTNKADFYIEKHSLHADRALVPPKSFYQGQKERLACNGLPATEKTSLCCDIHGFPGPLFKPLNHLEHISHTFYNILTQFPLPFHHRLPVRAKDSHKQILWSVSQKGSTCRVRSQSLLFLSRRTPLPIMNLQSNLGRIEKAHLKNKWPLFEMPVLQVGGWVWNLTAEQYGKVAFY